MTSIAATSAAAIPQRSPAVQATAGGLAGATDTTSIAVPPPPAAVVISVGQGAPVAAARPADGTAERRVDSLVEKLWSHNSMADALSHVSWTGYAQRVGEAKAAAVKAEVEKQAAYSTAWIGRELGASGIDARPATDRRVAETGIAPGTVLVRSFSFTEGGSTYAVTAREDGTLVGTRDGQAWKSWKTVPPNTWKTSPQHAAPADSSAAALATLQGLLRPAEPANTAAPLGLVHLNV